MEAGTLDSAVRRQPAAKPTLTSRGANNFTPILRVNGWTRSRL
jgi:hypothetical protein